MCRFKGLTSEDMLVYQAIQQAANTGIWTADLKKRTNLQQLQVNKALKNLESRSLVKPVKTVSVIPFFYHCRLLISIQGWFLNNFQGF
jgi:predicted transcriptional regulator